MIERSTLLGIINKYHLNSLIEAVKWEIENNILNIRFNAPSKEMIGCIEYLGFPLENSTIAISNTTQLNKLISITSGYIELSYQKKNKFIHKLILADKQFTLNYALADTMIIPKAGEFKDEDKWDITAPLDNESINAIVRGKSALAESETVVITPSTSPDGQFQIEMQFGGDIEHANKVSFYIPNAQTTEVIPPDFKEYYNSGIIREIMYANKEMPTGKISINLDGIMKLEFQNKNLKSTYYLVSKEI
jgi:hypothetical protein